MKRWLQLTRSTKYAFKELVEVYRRQISSLLIVRDDEVLERSILKNPVNGGLAPRWGQVVGSKPLGPTIFYTVTMHAQSHTFISY